MLILSSRKRVVSNSLLLQISKASEARRIHTTHPEAPVININCLGKGRSQQHCICCSPSSCTSGRFRSKLHHRRADSAIHHSVQRSYFKVLNEDTVGRWETDTLAERWQ